VLIGDAFVSCDRVALTCAVDAGPLLYALPEELASLQQLFVQLGVRDKFSGGDFVGALKRLADANRGSTLETQQIAWAAVLAREAAQYQMSAAEKEGMWLPDAAGEMTPARCLVYDDAPWLSSTLNDVRFVHKEVAGQVAEVLGLRSVRKLLISGELHMRDLACPSPEWLRQQLRFTPDTRQLPAYIVDIADCVGARNVHILFDFRSHPSQSVLQPNLAGLQGPAVVFFFEGLKMTAEELCRLQNAPQHKQALRRSTRVSAGLNSMYMATDVPAIISGEGFYFFDPKGTHFVDSEQKQARPLGKAHIFVNSDMHKKFADQFAPFNIFGFDPNRSLNGTILRLPLKKAATRAAFADGREEDSEAAAPASAELNVFDRKILEGDLENMLACCPKMIGPESLLFLENVESVEVSSWREGDTDMKLVFKTCLQSPVSPATRQVSIEV
jgi:sacsin